MGTGSSAVKVKPIAPILATNCETIPLSTKTAPQTTVSAHNNQNSSNLDAYIPSNDVVDEKKDERDPNGISFHSTEVKSEIRARRRSQNLFQNVVVENIERDIQQFYTIDTSDVLGDGLSGIVVRGINKQSGIPFAIKTLYKKNIKMDEYHHVKEEIRFMQELDHPNILRLHEYFEDNNFIFLVSELCTGGELLSRLYQQKQCIYSERIACEYIYSMISAIRYCHSKGIVHRDLKLENFLFVNEYPDSPLKLIDFGLSRHFDAGEEMHQAVGTPYYIAPEVLQGHYDARCDVWSLGVIAYMLLSGKPPFDGTTKKEILASIKSMHWNFNANFNSVSIKAKSFVSTCLSKVNSRPHAEELLHHPWFTILHSNDTESHVSSDAIQRLQGFGNRNILSRLCMEVIAHSMQADQIEGLRNEFSRWDTNNAGVISYADMRAILQASTAIKEDELEKIFQDINLDHTGEINYHEFIAATISRSTVREENLRLAFAKISDNQPYFTPADLTQLAGLDTEGEQVQASMLELHLDPTDKIDFDKFKELVADASYKTPKPTRKKMFFRTPSGNLTGIEGDSEANSSRVETHSMRTDGTNRSTKKPASTSPSLRGGESARKVDFCNDSKAPVDTTATAILTSEAPTVTTQTAADINDDMNDETVVKQTDGLAKAEI